MTIDCVVNFADPRQKMKHLAMVGALNEPHEVGMKPYKPRRSNNANRYWFGVCVKAFCQYQKDQGVIYSPERAHAFIVGEVLGKVKLVNHRTGEVYEDRPETKGMDKETFSDLIERGHAWLADWGIVLPTRKEFEQMEASCHRSTAS